ncbi:class I SAM-dependent methyltransferase [Azospirillum sp. ST 5-10]|uniref:class I SAM-dependent methyltransferase n=1 Tax=unclassified Azospirillum TaxID=2630922 RepID=UPI003F49F053
MTADTAPTRNWFDRGGRAYARFRPDYPPALVRFLAETAPARHRAVDVGCGNGQLTQRLADHFDEVVGLDPSADQIANAAAHERVRYVRAAAETIPLPDRTADLVTAAQAAHWFDAPRFHDEVRRIGRENALVALISYGVPQLAPGELDERFKRFYRQEIGTYWPPARTLVDTGYAEIPFPFAELPSPTISMSRTWGLGDFLGYVSTWSAVRRAVEAGRDDILESFAADLARLWGDCGRPVTWPVAMRLGRV